MKTSQAESLSVFMQGMLPKTRGASAVKLAMNYKKINDELSGYREERIKIFRKYGEEVEDKLIVKEGEKNRPFMDEMNEIGNIDINPDFQIITLKELEKTDLSSQDILILMDAGMVKEKEDDYSGV